MGRATNGEGEGRDKIGWMGRRDVAFLLANVAGLYWNTR